MRPARHSKASAAGAACDIAVLVSYSGDGGMERWANLLIDGFLRAGLCVDVVLLRRSGGHYAGIPSGARLVTVGSTHAGLAGPGLVRYLRESSPPVLLAVKDRAGRAAIEARRRAGAATRVFLMIGNTLSEAMAGRSWIGRKWRYRAIRRTYPHAHGIIASSQGVADDIIAISGATPGQVRVVAPPVLTAQLGRQARQAPEHPWLAQRECPVIIGVGRLTRQKDFFTLIRAFARLRSDRIVRLLILGEGEDRDVLTRLAHDLGVSDDIAMPGFMENPYAEMANADVFVLSSAWEGFGNVVAEAMALGLPIVSTDCRSGPREILRDGEYGYLTPVGDAERMANAIGVALDSAVISDRQRQGASRYTQERSTCEYMRVLGLTPVAGGSC